MGKTRKPGNNRQHGPEHGGTSPRRAARQQPVRASEQRPAAQPSRSGAEQASGSGAGVSPDVASGSGEGSVKLRCPRCNGTEFDSISQFQLGGGILGCVQCGALIQYSADLGGAV